MPRIRVCNFSDLLNLNVFYVNRQIQRGPSSSYVIRLPYSTRSRSMANKYDNKSLFVGDNQVNDYAQFRPTYPEVVFETIFNFCKRKPTHTTELAIDVGCGPGLSTLPLTKNFSKVVGVDVSQQQVSKAPTDVPGLTFRVSGAEDLSFVKDGSVDLITVAQSLHWIQLDRFYGEVDRILKPGGSIVAYGYGTLTVDHKDVHDYIMHIHRVKLSKYWASDRSHVENKYASLSLPYNGWLRNDEFVIEKQYSVEQLLGYLNSWSPIHTYAKENTGSDLIGEIRQKLQMICGDPNGENVFTVTWPIFMLMAQKPEKGIVTS